MKYYGLLSEEFIDNFMRNVYYSDINTKEKYEILRELVASLGYILSKDCKTVTLTIEDKKSMLAICRKCYTDLFLNKTFRDLFYEQAIKGME